MCCCVGNIIVFYSSFQPVRVLSINHIAKRISTTPKTIFCCYYFMQYLVSIFHLITSSIRSLKIYLLSKTENKFWLPIFTHNALQSGITSSLYIYSASIKKKPYRPSRTLLKKHFFPGIKEFSKPLTFF